VTAEAELGHIGNRVWLDQNANGIQDDDEGGLAGVSVALSDARSGTELASGRTNEGGWFGFSDLDPNRCYVLSVTPPAGHASTAADVGSDETLDSDLAPAATEMGWICLDETPHQDWWDVGFVGTSDTPQSCVTVAAPEIDADNHADTPAADLDQHLLETSLQRATPARPGDHLTAVTEVIRGRLVVVEIRSCREDRGADDLGAPGVPAAGRTPTPPPRSAADTTTPAPETPTPETPAPTVASPATVAPPTSTTMTTSTPTTTTLAPTTTTPKAATPPAEGSGRLVWSDEFDGAGLDSSKWNVEHSNYGWGNDELQYYRPENVAVSGGSLRIQGRPERYRGYEFTSGMVTTRNKATFTHGRFEMRARFPRGQGLWSAFWLSSEDAPYGAWPASGELDVVEVLGSEPDRVTGTAHWSDGKHQKTPQHTRLDQADTSEAFHTYAMEWTSDSIEWFVDGRRYHRSERSEWAAPGGGPSAPFDRDFHLKLNLSVGGSWPGAPDASTRWPAQMDVDWVRVYDLD